MFKDPELNIPVIGIIENMSYFIGDDGKKYDIFGHGGGQKASDDFKIKLFGQIPLVQKIREQGDEGKPIVLENPNHEVSKAFLSIAEQIALEIARKTFEINQKRPKNFVFEPLDLM
jgi:ATP-binding protein involved in chromosome partitioning